MSFLVKLLEKYNKIWYKVSNSIKKDWDTELVYNKTYKKTKIKYYEQKITAIFVMTEHQKMVLNIFVYQ